MNPAQLPTFPLVNLTKYSKLQILFAKMQQLAYATEAKVVSN